MSAPGSSDGGGGSQSRCKSGAADCEVATLARRIRQDSKTGDQRKTLNEWIVKLRDEQATQRAERKRIATELKNTMRRKRRLQSRARQLTNSDLMEVLLMRDTPLTEEQEKAIAEDASEDDDGDEASGAKQPSSESKKAEKSGQHDDADDPRSHPGAASSMSQL